MTRSSKLAISRLILICSILAGSTGDMFAKDPVAVNRLPDGVLVRTGHDQIKIAVCAPTVLHVIGGVDAPKPSSAHSPWIDQSCGSSPFTLSWRHGYAVLGTEELRVTIDLDSGVLAFSDQEGDLLLEENGDWARSYTPRGDPQDHLYQVSERFSLQSNEALYGLGQHQTGALDYRGTSIVLSQLNSDVAIPFIISTRGYGLIWNTASRSLVENRFPTLLKLTASAAEGLDFYFLYGPEFDGIIHQYRNLTGHVPLFPKWAYGFFQSKDRYMTQDELEGIVSEYRREHIPLDAIVQDGRWWTKQGSEQFNSGFPSFASAVKQIHAAHTHIMISIWPDFEADTPIAQQMTERGYLLKGKSNDERSNYDATNPDARSLYWKLLPSKLFAQGVDAFWMDASEPEQQNGDGGILPDEKLYTGKGELYTNVYPFYHTYGVYRNWRDTTATKRVFILSRSSFLGQQRNAAAIWSGDVYSNFWALQRQIPAGLNFALSGMPYWTTDIGGYYAFPNGNTLDPRYEDLFVRWLEFGVFCPVFRTHGRRANGQNELWTYGPATPILVKYDRLRYRLLPYIYSLAWQVTNNDYTIMRPLVMDWRTNRRVWEIADEFMFGPALLVSPVIEAEATKRRVYLPDASAWFDFWSGQRLDGNQYIDVPAPLDKIPLFVRAGSILMLGPEIEYADQKPDNPIEIRVYRGANASFEFYEDEGDNYNYEHGAHATIPIRWDESSRMLVIGDRIGEFPGMPVKRSFRIVWVGPDHGVGSEVTSDADENVVYCGKALNIVAPRD